jgi:Flp pilus assembly protein TadB
MSATRAALILGAIPIVVGIVYWTLQQTRGTVAVTDAAGVTMLVALGLAMGFGMLVILRGARDL